MQSLKRKRYQKDAAPSDDIITLIHLVRQNPALYNYKLQPNQRRRIDILSGWAQIAMQIGKYSIAECRRKWKNLRDTYHQYRLRKPKVGDGLSKWRYAKELDFLSGVYQPKLKSHRIKYEQEYGISQNFMQMQAAGEEHNAQELDDDGSAIAHPENITLVSDEAETFILHAYEESVNDDVAIDESGGVPHDDVTAMSHIEMTHDDNVDVEEIVKNEPLNSLDEDGATGAEVDYEEVCLYEESANANMVEGENGGIDIISGPGVGHSSSDSKAFQYIDTAEFCIEPVPMSSAHANIAAVGSNSSSNSVSSSSSKPSIFKAISSLESNNNTSAITSSATTTSNIGSTNNTAYVTTTTSGAFVHPQSIQTAVQTKDELDLFFEFLKNKMQRLSQVDITAIQIEFLNCVLRREADGAQKPIMSL